MTDVFVRFSLLVVKADNINVNVHLAGGIVFLPAPVPALQNVCRMK
jgi:hypothetical protein